MRRPHLLGAALLAASCAISCLGSTGGELVEFDAYAAGPETLDSSGVYQFENQLGYAVTLTKATLHIGAVYLNKSVPTSTSQDTSCYLPGVYSAEVTNGFDVDVLDPELQAFPVRGVSTTDHASTAEVWLTGGAIDAETDPTKIAVVAGVASRDGVQFPFEGTVTINKNRITIQPDPALPGAKPICKQRIVTPIDVNIDATEGGALIVRVDPADWFQNVDFAVLEQVDTSPILYRFRDDSEDQPSRNLFSGIRANAGVYRLTFEDNPSQ